MNATGKRRLLKLADFLETKVPRKRFNMQTWAEATEGSVADVSLRDCGTAACACGWATTIPSFKRAGFKLVHDPHSPDMPDLVFDRYGGFEAAEAFFEIDPDEARDLFSADSYSYIEPATPERVAKRIRDLVKRAA